MEAALKAVGIDTPKGYQLNHLVPDAVAQSDPMVVEMLKRNIYDVDHAGNLLPMPGEVRGSHPDLIGHLGSHGNYNDLVQRRLRQESRNLARKYGSLDKVPDNELKEAVKGVEDTMREDIIKRSPQIPTRYDLETGTRVLSEGISDPDFVA
jgi:A nuclease family of the HNH/ENDO VII superfamily with conserved AHH